MGALLTAAACYAGLGALLFGMQSSLVYYPHLGREIVTTPAARGLPYERVALRTSDGETLSAWWVPAPEQRGIVLLFHGNAGNISHRIDYLQMFSRLGYSTFIVDYRGYGESSGEPSEEGTYRDAEACWSWLESRGAAARDIVVFGESLGGGVARRVHWCWLPRSRPSRISPHRSIRICRCACSRASATTTWRDCPRSRPRC
ncbi:MAG: alpha/beta hydrolase [Rhodospirillaceae bacterium]